MLNIKIFLCVIFLASIQARTPDQVIKSRRASGNRTISNAISKVKDQFQQIIDRSNTLKMKFDQHVDRLKNEIRYITAKDFRPCEYAKACLKQFQTDQETAADESLQAMKDCMFNSPTTNLELIASEIKGDKQKEVEKLEKFKKDFNNCPGGKGIPFDKTNRCLLKILKAVKSFQASVNASIDLSVEKLKHSEDTYSMNVEKTCPITDHANKFASKISPIAEKANNCCNEKLANWKSKVMETRGNPITRA